ncbi:MAG: type II secretion system F family protein [Roseburia sp.]|nr:type II secretion system F family protein [Roseburia sp.]
MGDRPARWLYDMLERLSGKPNGLLHNMAVYRDLQTLEPEGNTRERQKEYVVKKLSLCGAVLLGGILLSLVVWMKEGPEARIADNRLTRNAYGEGSRSVTLVASDAEESVELVLELEEKAYTRQELEDHMETFLPLLEECVLGQNESFDRIEYDLNPVDGISGYPFAVEWLTDEEYIDCDGGLVQDTLENPKIVELTAQISCGEFRVSHVIPCYVHTKALQPEKAELLARQLNAAEQESRQEEFVTLPSEMNGQPLSWSAKRSHNGLLLLVGTLILTVLLYFGRDRDLHKQVEDREAQMRLDYPELVSALALLIGAGMTVAGAWRKVAADYLARKKMTKEKRYAYEEMLLMLHEMDNGESQAKAYEYFGRRCRSASYNRLAAMLSQNVRKGSANLAALLREEAERSFEERKHAARTLGEKAGTKLLAPMMLMLCMIMIIIMIPAFTGYF